jgi:Ala-tRNA(Pro) deacylase
MPALSERLKKFLDENGVDYATISHSVDFTAQQTAADTHTPGREFAKTVLVEVDGAPALAVLPAHCKVDTDKLKEALGAREVRLSDEAAMGRLCPDCDAGAVPPFGNLYDLPVYLAREMTEDEQITFNGGTHRTAVRMRFQDYERLVRPRVVDFAWNRGRPSE